jgi:hypothetical protein
MTSPEPGAPGMFEVRVRIDKDVTDRPPAKVTTCDRCHSKADTCTQCGTCRRCVEDCRPGCRNQGVDLGPYETTTITG